jgi:hypothetical protein
MVAPDESTDRLNSVQPLCNRSDRYAKRLAKKAYESGGALLHRRINAHK